MPTSEEPLHELSPGEFYFPYNIDPADVVEFDAIRDVESGIVVIAGAVGTGRTHLLQRFVDYHKTQGRKVLNIAYNHNELQGIDTFVFDTEQVRNNDGTVSLANTYAMLARIEAVAPDVVVMDDLDYAETTALAVMLVEEGIAVFATMREHENASALYCVERRLEEVEEIGVFDNSENLVKGLIKISRNLDSTVHRLDGKTKYIAKVETA
jgi:type II secretory ATPase GspE/PulE/Tfp pilus assembly ATPase PilB-like protein